MLTQILRDKPDVANELLRLGNKHVGIIRQVPPILAPSRTDHYALVGTAFDYLLRWEVQRRNRQAKDRPWVASLAVLSMKEHLYNNPALLPQETLAAYESVVQEAHRFVFGNYVQTAEPDSAEIVRACQYALCLANIDPYFRSGSISQDPGAYDREDVLDLQRLYAIVPWNRLGGNADDWPLLNPSFGSVSEIFRGADADLVIAHDPGDGVLIDYKTTKYFDLAKHLPQLLGYAMIAEEYRKEDPKFPVLDEAGIYFARHGRLETFSLVPITTDPEYEPVKRLLFDTARSYEPTVVIA